MRTSSETCDVTYIRFRRFGWKRHCLVVMLMALAGAFAYGPHLDATFAFDDEPNILRNPYFLSLHQIMSYAAGAPEGEVIPSDEIPFSAVIQGIWFAATQSPAPNRPLTNATFAWQIWRNEYHIDTPYIPKAYAKFPEKEKDAHRVSPAVDFHVWNVVLHGLCGISVYFLFIRLLQLPRVNERIRRYAWWVALVASFLWFASPVESMPTMYIVQRAVLMSTFFSLWAMILYLEYRAVSMSDRYVFARKAVFLLGAGLSLFLGLLSKEIAALIPLALALMEYALLLPSPEVGTVVSGWWAWTCALMRGAAREAHALFRNAAIPLAVLCLPVFLAVYHYYGKAPAPDREGFGKSQYVHSVSGAVERLASDAFGKVFSDEPRGKTRISRRQRLLTETRVVAMYQSLLLIPGWWRLNLDYDFPETTQIFAWEDMTLLPLVLVACLLLAWRFSPVGYRGVGMLAAVLLAHLVGLDAVWWRTWPIPAIVWHMGVLFLAVHGLRSSPLLSFCVFWFYSALLIESTVIGLELVFEHRMYLPGIAVYLLLTVVVFEAIMRGTNEVTQASVLSSEGALKNVSEKSG